MKNFYWLLQSFVVGLAAILFITIKQQASLDANVVFQDAREKLTERS